MIGQSPSPPAPVAELVSWFSLLLVGSFLPGLPLFLTLGITPVSSQAWRRGATLVLPRLRLTSVYQVKPDT